MQMKQAHPHGGDRVAAALEAQAVPVVFTLCGGHISPILTASKARGIRILDCRDEATAVFAADAFARLTGIPGVAAVTAGPGLTNAITPLKNAQLAQSPLVLIGGAAPTALQGRGALQDIDQRPLVEPHVKRFTKIRRVADLAPAVEEAFAVAREGVPGPVCIECPVDLLYDESNIRQWYSDAAGKGTSLPDRALRWYLNRHVEKMFAGSGEPASPKASEVVPPAPPDSSVDATAAALAKAERPLMVIGSQAMSLSREADRIAAAVAKLGIPVYLSGMARGLLGRDHPLQMRHARRNALRESDCVILAGVPCDFRLDYGRHVRRSATLVAANRSAKEARMNRRPTVAAIGDAGLFLQRLATKAQGSGKWHGWMDTLRKRDAEREVDIDAQAAAQGEYVNPLGFFRALDRAAGDNAVMVADGGDFVSTASYILRPRGPLAWLDPGVFGTLGVGAGFAIGAAMARPQSEVWIVYGDGACGYGLTEFDTFVRHGLPVIAVVGNDACWTQIAREQVKMLKDDVSTVLARTDYHRVAEGFGAAGIVVKSNAEVPAALERAREIARSGKPVLVNVWLDKTDFREGSISM
ncbi:MAG: thiamine pyrophosphate-binding protein [Burkholderiales bacterium]|jgi:acetolactate synthase-1/2/3 large subunit|nr:thiamine pyrophosphate-binding protein [Burkholderiales bacterium]